MGTSIFTHGQVWEYRNNNRRILRIYHNSNYLFTSVRLLCIESNSDGELTAYILECGVTYGIKVFDKEVVLFKSFYAKLMVLESFSLNSSIFEDPRFLGELTFCRVSVCAEHCRELSSSVFATTTWSELVPLCPSLKLCQWMQEDRGKASLYLLLAAGR